MDVSILSAFEKKLFAMYSAVILALTASGIMCVHRLYLFGFSELFLPC